MTPLSLQCCSWWWVGESRGVSPEVHVHLHCFERVELQVVKTAPDSQLLNLLSVSRLVTVLNEADQCGVVCKLDIGVFRYFIYIYIYAFSRRFYPKRLTLHSSYSFTFYQLLLSLGIEPMILALLVPCSTIWATGKQYNKQYKVWLLWSFIFIILDIGIIV